MKELPAMTTYRKTQKCMAPSVMREARKVQIGKIVKESKMTRIQNVVAVVCKPMKPKMRTTKI